MTDMVVRPIFMTHFPMDECIRNEARRGGSDADGERGPTDAGRRRDRRGVDEKDDYDELIAAYKANKLDPTPYYWYTNQSRYGTCPHGGDGLGTERFVVWLLGDNHIHDSCFNPPYINRSESSISFSRGKITSTRLSVDACTRGQPQPTGYAEQSIALLIRLNQYRLCDVHDGRRCVWHVPQSGVTMKHSEDWTTFLSR